MNNAEIDGRQIRLNFADEGGRGGGGGGGGGGRGAYPPAAGGGGYGGGGYGGGGGAPPASGPPPGQGYSDYGRDQAPAPGGGPPPDARQPPAAAAPQAPLDAGPHGGGAPPATTEAPPATAASATAPPDPTNDRIYVSGLAASVTEDDLAELFGQIGQLKRERQKRGYPDQWPYKIKLYKPGQEGGDGVLSYEDPSAAQAAPGWFNGTELKGATIKVQMASKPPPPAGGWRGGGGGGGGRRY